ncbi:MAG: hypothetical protein ACRC26_01980 [Bacteroidales bacterium]
MGETVMKMEKEKVRLQKKLTRLEVRLFEAERKETERVNLIPWGAGMRWSKISISTRKSDEIKQKIELVKAQLEKLNNGV